MKYEDFRDNLRSGDLVAWSHRGWRTWHDIKIQIVRMATRSEYSHVGLVWKIGGRLLVIEAVQPLVRIYPLSKLGSFYHIGMNAPWKPETEELALSHVGTPYSQLDALKAFFKPLGKNVVTECAALVLNVLSADGVEVGDRATPDAVVMQAQLYGHPTFYIEN